MRCVCLGFELRNRELMCFFFVVLLCPRTSNVVWVSRYNRSYLVSFGRRGVYLFEKIPSVPFRSGLPFGYYNMYACAVIDKTYNNIIFNRSEISYNYNNNNNNMVALYGRLFSIQTIRRWRWRRRLATVRLLRVFLKRVKVILYYNIGIYCDESVKYLWIKCFRICDITAVQYCKRSML